MSSATNHPMVGLRTEIIQNSSIKSAKCLGLWAFICSHQKPVHVSRIRKRFGWDYDKINFLLEYLLEKKLIVPVKFEGSKHYQGNPKTFFISN